MSALWMATGTKYSLMWNKATWKPNVNVVFWYELYGHYAHTLRTCHLKPEPTASVQNFARICQIVTILLEVYSDEDWSKTSLTLKLSPVGRRIAKYPMPYIYSSKYQTLTSSNHWMTIWFNHVFRSSLDLPRLSSGWRMKGCHITLSWKTFLRLSMFWHGLSPSDRELLMPTYMTI